MTLLLFKLRLNNFFFFFSVTERLRGSFVGVRKKLVPLTGTENPLPVQKNFFFF